MEGIKAIKSDLNRAIAQLKQLCTSDHFTDAEINELAPKMAMNVRKLQRKYDTARAKNKKVTAAISVTST
ncbi:hypothetical protein [Aquimarina aggregata]|uniref:hypothetical protein n=1 Tax=Aquimarina aggregata TaxID=1642818 RepID=UPI002493B95C|nr:hypothetical protein [Aquimarina aggregata]